MLLFIYLLHTGIYYKNFIILFFYNYVVWVHLALTSFRNFKYFCVIFSGKSNKKPIQAPICQILFRSWCFTVAIDTDHPSDVCTHLPHHGGTLAKTIPKQKANKILQHTAICLRFIWRAVSSNDRLKSTENNRLVLDIDSERYVLFLLPSVIPQPPVCLGLVRNPNDAALLMFQQFCPRFQPHNRETGAYLSREIAMPLSLWAGGLTFTNFAHQWEFLLNCVYIHLKVITDFTDS